MSKLTPALNKSDHVQGNKEAYIVLVEYGDYQCPHCGQAYSLLKKIQNQLGNNLLFAFRNFPLAQIHPNAIMAAIAAEAADVQGKFWEMHDVIFENQKKLDTSSLLTYADDVGLNRNKMEADLNEPELLARVSRDFENGIRSGVNGTPSFFINGLKYNDPWGHDELLSHLEKLINQPR